MAELEIKPSRGSRLRVTALVAAAVVIATTVVLLLAGVTKGFSFRRATIYTYLPDATGLTTESEVRLSGLHIGSVAKVELSGLLDRQRTVRVDLRVAQQYLKLVPQDSITSISTDTLVGPAFVSIAEGKSRVTVAANGTLASEPLNVAQDRADIVQAFKDRLRAIDQIVQDISSPNTKIGSLFVGDAEYQKIMAEVSAFERSARGLVSADNAVGQALFSDALYNRVRDPITKVDETLATIQRGEGAAGKLFASDEQYNTLVRQLKDLHTVLADLNAGKGTGGEFLKNEEAHRKVLAMARSTNALLTSITAGPGAGSDLLRNPQLYEALTGSLRDLTVMMKDFRENPKKYLRYKPF